VSAQSITVSTRAYDWRLSCQMNPDHSLILHFFTIHSELRARIWRSEKWKAASQHRQPQLTELSQSWFSGNVLDSYSGGSWLGSRTEHRLSSQEDFRCFPASLQANAVSVPWLGTERFLPNNFQFISHLTLRNLDTVASWNPTNNSASGVHRIVRALVTLVSTVRSKL
jgi:hypothetical protein